MHVNTGMHRRATLAVSSRCIAMKINVGFTDRFIRTMLGLALLSLLLTPGNARWFGLLGLIPLLTAVVGMCPLYRLFGIDTRSRKAR